MHAEGAAEAAAKHRGPSISVSTAPRATPRWNARAALLPRLVNIAALLPAPLVRRMRTPLAFGLARVARLRPRAAASMAAALGPAGYAPRHLDAYFDHLGELLCLSALLYRGGLEAAGLHRDECWQYSAAAEQRFREAVAAGRGVVLAAPHLVGHELAGAFLARRLPVAVLTRRSPQERYGALKETWYRRLGVEMVYRPGGGGRAQGLAELAAALRPLRRGKMLAIAPDLLQRPGTGLPVTLFGRTAELPAGPFFLAARTGAPLLPAFFHREGPTFVLADPPAVEVGGGSPRDELLLSAAQCWSTAFEAHLRAHPDMWLFWLDRKWTRWLGGG